MKIVRLIVATTLAVLSGFGLAYSDIDDYHMSKDDLINGIVDKHLKKDMGPNENQYRQELG